MQSEPQHVHFSTYIRLLGGTLLGVGASTALAFGGMPRVALLLAAILGVSSVCITGLQLLHMLVQNDGSAPQIVAPQDAGHRTKRGCVLRPASCVHPTIPAEPHPPAQSLVALAAALAEQRAEHDKQLRRTTLLTRLSIELRASHDPQLIAQEVLAVITANTDADRASIMLLAPDGAVEQASMIANGQVCLLDQRRAQRLIDYGLAGWALRHSSNVVLADIGADERWARLGDAPDRGSAMALLLQHGQATLGVLTITNPDQGHFTSHDLLLFEGAAAQVSVALSAARRLHEERRRRDQALVLFATTQFLTTRRTAAELAAELLAKSAAVFDAELAALFLVDQAGTLSPFQARPSADAAPDIAEEPIEQLAWQAWQARQARSTALPGSSRACVALPLLHNGVAIGTLALVRRSQGPALFTADTWSLLMVFSNVAAAAFVNLQLIDQLRQRAQTLQQLVDERTAQLAHSRDLLRVIFDHLPDGLVLLDPQQQVLMANQAFCSSVPGWPSAQVLGRRYPEVIAALQEHHTLRIDPAPDNRRGWRACVRDTAGGERWYAIDRYAVHSSRADRGVIERWRDVTREEELHRQILRHEQLTSLARLAASVVHEVGNPLQSVRSCLDLCGEDSGLADATAEYLQLADAELERMSGILNRLRDLYRPPQLVWEYVDLNKLVIAVRHITARQFAAHSIEVAIALAPELPRLQAQADSLRQVLLNLLLNAQAAMPGGGSIHIGTAADPGRRRCCFRVRDTGIGIGPERLARIFEPFYSDKAQGLGLGLYISRQVAEQHGGTIEIASCLGAGTTITVWLPYGEEKEITYDEESYALAR